MPLDIKQLIQTRLGENYELHEKYVNPALVRVLRTIGFDKIYARAEGCHLYDREGNQYLDFLGGYSVFNIGRNHPAVKKVLADLLELDMPNMVQMDCSLLSGLLAEKLVSLSPPHLNAVFLSNSGTESIEGAIKFARAATGRSRIVHCDHSFHGLSCGSLSLNGNPEFREGFGELLPGTAAVPLGDLGALERELGKRDVAAFVIEPIQGKGVHLPKDDFWPKAQEVCRRHGTLFVCDEVQTGLGRTGKWFAFQHWNLEPDIVTIAKSLSGGLVPVGAILTRRSIYEKTFSRMDRCVVHSTTFGRNNLAMAAGLAALAVLEEENLIENSARMGELMMQKLNALKEKHELIKEVRGKGLMIAVEFGSPSSLKLKMAWNMIHAVNKGLFAQMIVMPLMSKHRVLSQVAGHNMDVIKVLPPLTITEKEVDQFVTALDDVVTDCYRLPGPMWELGQNLLQAAMRSKAGR